MKKVIVTAIISLCLLMTSCLPVPAQQSTLAKFIITDASNNGRDITPLVLEQQAYIVFYISSDNVLHMAIYWPKQDSQSYGGLYAAKTVNQEETYETYKADIIQFNWHYTNSYNNKEGTAAIKLTKIYKSVGVTFILKVITESLDMSVYKGYMEGSINFSDYK